MPARQGPPGRKHDKARHDVDKRQHFRIADFGIHLVCCGLDAAAECLLPSFAAFTHQEPMGEPLFTLTVNDKQEPARRRTLVRRFDTGNGDTSVYTTPHGGYEYIIRDTKGRDCCLMAANSDFTECSCALNGTTSMRSFGLNNAMMMAFAFAASRKDALLIHASCVLHDGRAYSPRATCYDCCFPFEIHFREEYFCHNSCGNSRARAPVSVFIIEHMQNPVACRRFVFRPESSCSNSRRPV